MFGESRYAAISQADDDADRDMETDLFLTCPYLLPAPSDHLFPWQPKGHPLQDDFIMISEFCELEGPKPLISIPRDAGEGFDKNEFVVRIMAVDHQTSPGGFSVSEDTQVLLTELKHGAYAYVHHFTLYDHQARGFVRPFCMSYVTSDSKKLVTLFEDLSAEFMKVSQFFKYGNRLGFVIALENHLHDLEYTYAQAEELQSYAESDRKSSTILSHLLPEERLILQNASLPMLQQALHEVKVIFAQVSATLTHPKLEAHFKRLSEKARANAPEMMPSNSPLEPGSLAEGDCYLHQRMMQPSREERVAYSYNEVFLTDSFYLENREPPKQRRIVKLGKRRFEKCLRGLHELCSWGAKEALTHLRHIHTYFCRDMATLLVERDDSALMDRPSTLLTIGRCIQANFLQNINVACSQECWAFVAGASVAREITSQPPKLHKKWLSTDTVDSFKSLDSFLSSHGDDTPLGNSVASSFEPALVMGSAVLQQFSGEHYLADPFCDSTSSPLTSPVSGHAGELTTSDSSFTGSDAFFTPDSEMPPRPLASMYSWSRRSSDSEAAAFSSCIDIPDVLADICDNPEHSLSTTPAARRWKVAVFSMAENTSDLAPGRPGYCLLSLCLQYSNLEHIIFSILTGRPVVVMGNSKQQDAVKDALNSLAIFLPGYANAFFPSSSLHSRSLHLPDLSRFRLTGVCRPERRSADSMLPNSIQKYVSLLDLDRKIIVAPVYQGDFITCMLSRKRQIRTEETFLAFIHSILLEMSSKSFLFYHICCLQSQRPNGACDTMTHYQLGKHAVEASMATLGIRNSDVNIVQHLVEVVMEQQLADYLQYSSAEMSNSSIPVNVEPCQVFRCS